MAFRSNLQPGNFAGDFIGSFRRGREDAYVQSERDRIAGEREEAQAQRDRIGGMLAGGDREGAMTEAYSGGDIETGEALRESLAAMDEQEREKRIAFTEASGKAAAALAQMDPEQAAKNADMVFAVLDNQFPGMRDELAALRAQAQATGYSPEAMRSYAQAAGQTVEQARTIMSMGGGDIGVFDTRTGEMVNRVEGETMDEYLQRREIDESVEAKYRRPESERSQIGRYRVMDDGRVFDSVTGQYKEGESGGGVSIIPGAAEATGADAPVAVSTPEEAAQLPPGTLIRTPDGEIRRTRGQ